MSRHRFVYRIIASAVVAVAVLAPRPVSPEHAHVVDEVEPPYHPLHADGSEFEAFAANDAAAYTELEATSRVRGQRRTLLSRFKTYEGQKAMLRKLQNIFTHKASKGLPPPPPPPLPSSKSKSIKGSKSKKAKSKGVFDCLTKGPKGKGEGKGTKSKKEPSKSGKGKGKGKVKSSKFLCSSAPSPQPTAMRMPTPRPTVMNMNMTVANMTMTMAPSRGGMPTRKPTGKPTFAPTQLNTASSPPSSKPSRSPAPSQSSKPSQKPSQKPTQAPTPAMIRREANNGLNSFAPTSTNGRSEQNRGNVDTSAPSASRGQDLIFFDRSQEGRNPTPAPTALPSQGPTPTPRAWEGQRGGL